MDAAAPCTAHSRRALRLTWPARRKQSRGANCGTMTRSEVRRAKMRRLMHLWDAMYTPSCFELPRIAKYQPSFASFMRHIISILFLATLHVGVGSRQAPSALRCRAGAAQDSRRAHSRAAAQGQASSSCVATPRPTSRCPHQKGTKVTPSQTLLLSYSIYKHSFHRLFLGMLHFLWRRAGLIVLLPSDVNGCVRRGRSVHVGRSACGHAQACALHCTCLHTCCCYSGGALGTQKVSRRFL